MARFEKASPWIEFYREMQILFDRDPDIEVVWHDSEKEIKIYVDGGVKAEALEKHLPVEKDFGGEKIRITVVPSNNTALKSCKPQGLVDVFNNNGAVCYIEKSGPLNAYYIVFKKEVVQYDDDNLGDIHRLRSVLMEDIARRIFEDAGVFFCTDNAVSLVINQNGLSSF